ncbi:hypothetical protein GCM10027612_73840 [Microbispora bryophytorum subsp. camponoti]
MRDDGFWSSVRLQRGNASDALMRHVHGPDWRVIIGGHPGRLRRHALTTGMGLLALTLAATGGAAGGSPPPRGWRGSASRPSSPGLASPRARVRRRRSCGWP